MKLGEVKIEALKLMDLCGDEDIFAEKIEQLQEDDNYREFLIRMNGSINRAFGRIESLMVLPLRYHRVQGEKEGERMRFLISSVPKLHTYMGVTIERENGSFDRHYPHVRLGDEVILDGIGEGDSVRVAYRPTITRIAPTDRWDTEVDLPEDMAALLPYYIKGELYRVDEPDEAQEAMMWFEQRIMEAARYEDAGNSHVQTVYSQ